MSNNDSISIAVLSGDQDDAALVNSTLRDAGMATHCHWVEKPNALADTLCDHRVELIIHNVDSYPDSVRQVIKQKDRFDPEVPVIAVREAADEQSIEDAMQQGASDLVSLGLISRLQAVIKRELRALRVERALNSTLQSATEYKRQIRDHMKSSTSAIALVQEGVMIEANEEWLKAFKAASMDELEGMPVMDSFDEESRAALKGALVATLAGKWHPSEQLKARPAVDGNEHGELSLELTRIEFDNDPCVQIRIPYEELHSKEPTKLVHDALQRDPTTLFYHRAQFLERLKKRLIKKPTSGLQLLAYIKPDNFQKVVKRVGVLNSEEILAQFSEIVRKRMHPKDIAGRFEGTSLMVLLERGKERDGQVWGQQLADFVSQQTFEVNDISAQITCSIGVCAVSSRFDSFEEFVTETVETCRQARKDGGSQAILSEADEEDSRQKELDGVWSKRLKGALMDSRFALAQLPIAGLRSDAVEMYDLLVRMLDEQGKSVLPSEFLPAAERTNMMKSIDRWMIKAAIEHCERSEADRVFVRMSRQSITDESTAEWIKTTCDEAGFDASRLVIEIPERDAAKHIRHTRQLSTDLKAIGVRFALEHFGTSDDKFQILGILNPDYIKVDGELMHSLMTDTEIQEQVRRIVSAASEKGIKTIAERVENANAMAVLFQLGLDYMQGHYVHEAEVVLSDDTSNTKQQTLAELMATG
ncbi:MAG: EAL domain-containing protein [Pseudomonadota bacterium]